MNTSNIEDYKEILYRLLNMHDHFETTLQDGIINDKIRDSMVEDLGDTYKTFPDLRKDIEKIVVPEKTFSNKLFSDKVIAFLYCRF